MRILFISSWYPTPENPNFGIFVKEHAKAIQTTEVEIIVLTLLTVTSKSLFKIKLRDFTDDSNIRTVEVTINSRFRDLVYHLVPLQNKICYHVFKKRIAKDFKPDIIHSNVIFPAGMMGYYISGKLHKPHIITEHWSKIESILGKPYLSGLAKKSYHNAAFILPVSNFLKKNIQDLLPQLPEEKLRIIPNVINSDPFCYKEKKRIEDEIQFCSIASWATKKVPDKKPELFIEALNQIQRKTNMKIRLVMIGGGDRVEELKQLCNEKSFKTIFTGYLSKSNIAEIIQKSDYYIHASTIETFGVVVAEALMTGTPVICSNVAALPELIDTKNGILCENTIEDWVRGINSAINTMYDYKGIAEKIKNKYSYENVGIEIFNLYKTVMS